MGNEIERTVKVDQLREQLRHLSMVSMTEVPEETGETFDLIVKKYFEQNSMAFVGNLLDFLADGGRVVFTYRKEDKTIPENRYEHAMQILTYIRTAIMMLETEEHPFEVLDQLLFSFDDGVSLDHIVDTPDDFRVLVVEAIAGIVRHSQLQAPDCKDTEAIGTDLIGMCNRHVKNGRPGFAHGLAKTHKVYQNTWLDFANEKIEQIQELWL